LNLLPWRRGVALVKDDWASWHAQVTFWSVVVSQAAEKRLVLTLCHSAAAYRQRADPLSLSAAVEYDHGSPSVEKSADPRPWLSSLRDHHHPCADS
jgi:hypothetical protein